MSTYDVTITDGTSTIGFQLDQTAQQPYLHYTEQTTANRFDNSGESGEQSLNALPWIKSQTSWHGGAGQKWLEPNYYAGLGDADKLAHARYEMSMGVDPWTQGELRRLDDPFVWYSDTIPNAPNRTAVLNGGVDVTSMTGATNLDTILWIAADGSLKYATNMNGGTPAVTTLTVPGGTGGKVDLGYEHKIISASTLTYYMVARAGGNWKILRGQWGSAPVVIYAPGSTQGYGAIAWVKSRLMYASQTGAVYELNGNITPGSNALPAPTYTPSEPVAPRAFAESPTAILCAVGGNGGDSILAFDLDQYGSTPTLNVGRTAIKMPTGESIQDMLAVQGGSKIAIVTSAGLRISPLDPYTGDPVLGPITVPDVRGPMLEWENFLYLDGTGTFYFNRKSHQYPDGADKAFNGLLCVNLAQPVDSDGRFAWCPWYSLVDSWVADDYGDANVIALGIYEGGARVNRPPLAIFMANVDEGTNFFLMGANYSGAGSDSSTEEYPLPAWIALSRTRYGTSEPKLFTEFNSKGNGYLKQSLYSLPQNAVDSVGNGPYYDSGVKIGDDWLGSSPANWPLSAIGSDPKADAQYRVDLGKNGPDWNNLDPTTTTTLESISIKAIPVPQRQEIIQFSCLLYESERNASGDQSYELTQERLDQLIDMANRGALLGFTRQGLSPYSRDVVIENIQFQQEYPPAVVNQVGGTVVVRLRCVHLPGGVGGV